MRILYLDLDTLRPDHLGCYGYERNTSPNLDAIASEGVRFTNYYATDVPCLPSRSALFTGRFGIHTGVVGHGGTAADPVIQGYSRGFRTAASATAWMSVMRRAGFRTVTVSPFAERHSAWWFYTGFLEMFNPGKGGLDLADEVVPIALDWLERNAEKDDWFLHVNLWDPHTPYDAPDEFGNPFEDEPPPAWLTEEILERHKASYGPHSAREPIGWDEPEKPPTPRMPTTIADLGDYKRWIDGYDVGIRYADDRIGRIFDLLRKKKVMEDLIVIISGDHAENQGELNVYGDHQTADYCTNRVPLIIRWPGMKGGGLVDEALHYNVDLPPTMADLLGQESPKVWDGTSFASTMRDGKPNGHEYLVLSQCAWSCQRAVRFGPWIMIRTYHDGLKEFPPRMLFNLEEDPHETNNLAEKHPDIVSQAHSMLDEWHTEMMASSESAVDPLWTVMREGGPLHTRDMVEKYCDRLRATGRGHHAERLEKLHGR
jgi:choline-sulfatase